LDELLVEVFAATSDAGDGFDEWWAAASIR